MIEESIRLVVPEPSVRAQQDAVTIVNLRAHRAKVAAAKAAAEALASADRRSRAKASRAQSHSG